MAVHANSIHSNFHKKSNQVMSKTLVVADQFRTNELSLKPGGSSVSVISSDGSQKIYTKVKNPKAYVQSILNRDPSVAKVLVDGNIYWTR
jgi:hypothetical protein